MGIALVLVWTAVFWIWVSVPGLAHQTTSNQHGWATDALHVDSDGIVCKGWEHAASQADNKRWDGGDHTVTLSVRESPNGVWTTKTYNFTSAITGASMQAWRGHSAITYGKSTVDGIHFFWDLVYPRYLHDYKSYCWF